MTYSVTIKIASQGTLHTGTDGNIGPSDAGHMWFSVSDGVGNNYSFGMQSREGTPGVGTSNDGVISDRDDKAYAGTDYQTTISITKEQYDKRIQYFHYFDALKIDSVYYDKGGAKAPHIECRFRGAGNIGIKL